MDPTTSHQQIDARLLKMMQAIAAKIDGNPALLEKPRDNLLRVTNRRVAEQWRRLLALPWPDLRILVLEDSERGRDLRQNAPFGGVLTDEERMRFYR